MVKPYPTPISHHNQKKRKFTKVVALFFQIRMYVVIDHKVYIYSMLQQDQKPYIFQQGITRQVMGNRFYFLFPRLVMQLPVEKCVDSGCVATCCSYMCHIINKAFVSLEMTYSHKDDLHDSGDNIVSREKMTHFRELVVVVMEMTLHVFVA